MSNRSTAENRGSSPIVGSASHRSRSLSSNTSLVIVIRVTPARSITRSMCASIDCSANQRR
jgi:hypothetical protein